MDSLPRISVIIPTKDRLEEITALFDTLFKQTLPPNEVVIVDDSSTSSTKNFFDSISTIFNSSKCEIKYARGTGDGLPAARNLGIKISNGEIILFLNDDTILDQNLIRILVAYLIANPSALGVQPNVTSSARPSFSGSISDKFLNAFNKAFMLSYYEKDMSKVRISGAFVFPKPLTKTIPTQRLSGCCFALRREVFKELSFDTNLKRWAFAEDLDLSYRTYQKYPNALFLISKVSIIHNSSEESRLPSKTIIQMQIIHWFYLFFKNMFKSSLRNLLAFAWAITGNLVSHIGVLIFKRPPRYEWWSLIYLVQAYSMCYKNLANIQSINIAFYNRILSIRD